MGAAQTAQARLNCGPVRILCVATKPPWPAIDGGRLVLWKTIEALSRAGHQISLVAPEIGRGSTTSPDAVSAMKRHCKPTVVGVRRRSVIDLAPSTLLTGLPITVLRHHHALVQAAVAHEIGEFAPEVVHVEQLQAFSNAEAALVRGYPVVLREQNVEADLWLQMATKSTLLSPVLRFEAMRLRHFETTAVRRSTRVATLTERDAVELRLRAGMSSPSVVRRVGFPFPAHLTPGQAMVGDPAVAIGGSGGWAPNVRANQRFIANVWPVVLRRLPRAVLHVFGGRVARGPSVCWHAAPVESQHAFPHGAIAVVTLDIASGIRMRILEAWARRLPVVASPVAAAGLDATDGDELLLAESADQFATAIQRLFDDVRLRDRLQEYGTRYLCERHDETNTVNEMLDVYREAINATSR